MKQIKANHKNHLRFFNIPWSSSYLRDETFDEEAATCKGVFLI